MGPVLNVYPKNPDVCFFFRNPRLHWWNPILLMVDWNLKDLIKSGWVWIFRACKLQGDSIRDLTNIPQNCPGTLKFPRFFCLLSWWFWSFYYGVHHHFKPPFGEYLLFFPSTWRKFERFRVNLPKTVALIFCIPNSVLFWQEFLFYHPTVATCIFCQDYDVNVRGTLFISTSINSTKESACMMYIYIYIYVYLDIYILRYIIIMYI